MIFLDFWQAKPYLQAGEFEIVDESLKGTYDEESMRKTASIASRSVDRDASQRPNIAEVLAELKKSYSIQLSYLATGGLSTWENEEATTNMNLVDSYVIYNHLSYLSERNLY